MVRKLIDWALANPLIALLVATALAVGGGYAFIHANIEAYPDPAPAIIEVVAQYPGASAEEVERQVTVPLEVSLAGMPGLETTRSKSLFGLSHIRNQFDYSRDYEAAKQDVLNRIAAANLPPGVTPQISPASPIGEIIRYTLVNPTDPATGKPVYTLSDLKAVQDYTLQRELLRVPRVAGVTGYGGTVKRYEVQPDPQQMKKYGVTLAQVQAALGAANTNGSGDNLTQGEQTVVVRSLGLVGGGRDPQQQVLTLTDPVEAAAVLRAEEARRCAEIRRVVVATVNNVPVKVDQIVDGGPALNYDGTPRVDDTHLVERGVVVGYQTRQGRVSLSRPLRARAWKQLSEQERKFVRAQNGWPEEPPEPALIDQFKQAFTGKPPEAGNPEASVWWRDEDNHWQARPATAKPWADLTADERAAARKRMGGRLPAGDGGPDGWRLYPTADGGWDGWDDSRWADEEDVVQGVVLLRKGKESMPALKDVLAKIDELNRPGHLPPGMKIAIFYNRSTLIEKTTETVHENLLVGMALVSAILLLFLGNVRAAVIVAVNIPLALLFAFGVLFLRGKSANLLSIGAVDFGIIVDSSVIIVESIYRHLTHPEHPEWSQAERISRACGQVTKSLLFATLIMVCALLPLFTMTGPEGQIFGPMADTYAFALGGALVLAVVLSPVLCLLLMRNLKPKRSNFLVRGLQWLFVTQFKLLRRVRFLALLLFVVVLAYTGVVAANMGREFMPELEEGSMFVRGTFPVSVSIESVTGDHPLSPGERVVRQGDRTVVVDGVGKVTFELGPDDQIATDQASGASVVRRQTGSRGIRQVLKRFPECGILVTAIGRPDDGTDPTGYYNVETNIPLRPQAQWPAWIDVDFPRVRAVTVEKLGPEDKLSDRDRELRAALERAASKAELAAAMRDHGRPVPGWWAEPRSKAELLTALNAALDESFPGVDFDISQIIRDNVMEALSGVKGENSIKVFGPDLDTLETTAMKIRDELNTVPGVQNAGVFRIQGQSNLEFPVDRQKAAYWGVTPADVQAVVQAAVGGKATTQIQEGEKLFDLTVRWPGPLRWDQEEILKIPVPVSNVVTPGGQVVAGGSPVGGGGVGLSPTGTTVPPPSPTGNPANVPAVTPGTNTVPLSALVTPLDAAGRPAAGASFKRAGASTIYREQGQRFIAIKFEVAKDGPNKRDLASTVAEAKEKAEPLVRPPYRTEWSGEFKQMEAAEKRIAVMFLISFVLIAVFIYLAFRSVLDTVVVLANVLGVGIGGVWALKVVELNFNISAAVGFISILGVAVMNGLIMVSSFNGLRAKGMPLAEAQIEGIRTRVRPLMMTLLTAILGLLPAAFSTAIGSQSQRPLAVVVVGGMVATLILFNLMPLLYSLYGHRTPPAGAGDMAH